VACPEPIAWPALFTLFFEKFGETQLTIGFFLHKIAE
jgi:hypothetical protein